MAFERLGSDEAWSGKLARVEIAHVRYDDGEEAEREVVVHPGSVAVLAVEDGHVYLVSQPREAVDEQALVELPAGKLDEEGESSLDTARRELTEEIGKGARDWRHLTTFYASPGFSDEQIELFLATGLHDERAHAEDTDRIEIERLPLGELDRAIAECRDAKTLVGLLWLRAYRDELL